jgi:hypothetical protein
MDNQNVCSDDGYVSLVNMRNRFKLFNVPPERYDNLQNSPYNNSAITQQQLNMRRKVEILKYSANQSNTKTNNLTKKEKWALLVNGASQRRNLSYSYIGENLIPGTTNYVQTCPSGTTIYTPTYASGIPGPVMYLYEDPNVPLYMYSKKVDTYGILNQEVNTTEFTYDSNKFDIYLSNSTNDKIITSLYIQNINTPIYNFTIQFSMSIFITATVKPNFVGTFNETITISILPLQHYIKYGTNIVDTNSLSTFPTQKYVTFNISMNLANGSFSGNQYIGNYMMTNLVLNTQPNYIYDIGFIGDAQPDIIEQYHIKIERQYL